MLLCEDGVVLRSGAREQVEIPASARQETLSGAVLAPGYVDLHVHGAAGYDVMAGSADGLRVMAAFLARHGVTSFLPTTMTAGSAAMLEATKRLADHIEHWAEQAPIARPAGIHAEGPWISRQRRGVHPADHIQNPTLEFLAQMHTAARGKLRMITMAPELPGAIEVIREAVGQGVTVSIGHTDGEFGETMAAIEAGASHATHTFNAMRGIEHRRPGAAGAVLASHRLLADIIADGIHVDPHVVDLFLRCKGEENAVLITDATSATGMPDGTYTLGGLEVTVTGTRCESHGRLAGSVLTLDRAVQNVMAFAGWPLYRSVRLATANPGRVLRDGALGSLVPGGPANFIALSPTGEVLRTFIGGRPVS